jgi:lipopolysaccharide/colanic/teichoic acid biosynthesis glycosyltransferase
MKTETSTLASLDWGRTESSEAFDVSSESMAAKIDDRSRPNYETYPCPFWKRGLDYVAIIVSLPIVLPVAVAISLWVKLSSRGPVLFRQERVGFSGEHFTMYKFRSMRKAAATDVHMSHVLSLMENDEKLTKLDKLGDDRLIPGGALLRMASLDELPQLWNVLKGEMSLVGPRPCLPEEYALYKPEQKGRFAVQPGLTGYWQIMGKNRTTFSEMIGMDCTYVRKRSMLLDLFIIAQTPCALARQFVESRNPMMDVAEGEKENGESL